MEDAELLQRDANQLVLDVYASGRQNMLRDELVIAKTVDFLVEHATAVSSETVAASPTTRRRQRRGGRQSAGKAGEGRRQGSRRQGPRRPGGVQKKTSDE